MSGISEPDRPPRGNAWVTLATNDTYALGALVLARSLNKAATKYAKCAMITNSVSQSMKSLLEEVFDSVVVVDLLDSADAYHLAMLARPELGITFTKIHCWLRIEYGKCVFLDADTLVLENCDELFDREELSASPDVGWPDCFNSGVFVFRPSAETFASLVSFALHTQSFDGGDQGLLNLFFKNWALEGPDKRLPFIYNMCSTACYSYIPAFKMFGGAAKIVHFIGPRKPWMFEINPLSGRVNPAEFSHLSEYLQNWWDLCVDTVLPKLTTQMAGLPAVLSALSIGDSAGRGLEEHWRRTAWESSTADYMGRDSFDKVWEKIQATLEEPKLADDVSGRAEESTGGKSPASGDSDKPVPAEAPAEDPKGAPSAVAAAFPAVATPPLPSALVDVDSSSASNLGSLAQTVSQAVAPSLSSLEPSLPPAGSELNTLKVDHNVTGKPSVAFNTLAVNLISAEVAPSPIPSDSGLAELSAGMHASDALCPDPSLSDSILPECPAESQSCILALPDSVFPNAPAELITTKPAVPVLAESDTTLPEPSAESYITEQSAIPIPASSDSALPEHPAGTLTTELVIPDVPKDLRATPAEEVVKAAPVAKGEGPVESGDPRLEPVPVPSAPLPVPRTPTVIEATPPTSPPIGQAGAFPLAPPAPALVGAALAKERAETAPASQSDAEVAPIPPKRRGGPSKGGKSAVQKGKK